MTMATAMTALIRLAGATVRARVDAAAGAVDRDDLVSAVYAAHATEVAALRDELALARVRKLVDEILKSDVDSDEQMLPGLDLNRVIKIGDATYISARKATWADLERSEQLMADNFANVAARLRLRRRTMRQLRPYMESFPTRTVAEADAIRRGVNP